LEAGLFAVDQAMVQVIENRADIDGHITAIEADPARPEHRVVRINVTAAASVEGYANLFSGAAGKQLEAVFPMEATKQMRVGDKVRCRVRRAGPSTVIGEHCSDP
jgi:hypothetical protein